MKKIIVAIDGFSSCGKSTMAKMLAKSIGYAYIDSGAMYRAITLWAIKHNLFKDQVLDQKQLQDVIHQIDVSFKFNSNLKRTETYLNGQNVEDEIRSMEVSNKVSEVAALKFVRKVLVLKQQEIGLNKGLVMDGRDIGTVVFPTAELKIFVTASAEVRAQRRFDELQNKNQFVTFREILENVIKRDEMDVTRSESPLRKAEDAIELDNTFMTIEEQQTWLLDKFNMAVNR